MALECHVCRYVPIYQHQHIGQCSPFEVYYCKAHTYLILLNRQRSDKPETLHGSATKLPPAFRPVNRTPSAHSSPTTSLPDLQRGRPMVLVSAAGILTAFLYFYTRAPALLVSWTIGQQAFNSSMLLLLDAIETGNLSHIEKVEHAYVVFRELQDNGVHKLAALAVEKLSWGLDRLRVTIGERGTLRPLEETDAKLAAHVSQGDVRGGSRDTVMGGTGMVLLEEQGLQSYTTDCFAPFTCLRTKAAGEATTSRQLKKEQDSQAQGCPDPLSDKILDGLAESVPIVKEPQDGAKSPLRPACGRYRAPSSQEHFQRQSTVTGLAAPMDFGVPVTQEDRKDASCFSKCRHQQQRQSPHSQHRESRQTTPPSVRSPDQRPKSGSASGNSVTSTQTWYQLASSPRNDQMLAGQMRHHSCPAPHELGTAPPLLRPTYSSPLTNKVHRPLRDEQYSVHNQWPVNHNTSMLDSAESGMVTSPTIEQEHVVPDVRHRGAPQHHMIYQYSLPNHPMATSPAEDAAMVVEQMTVEQWTRWVDSGAHA